MNWRPLIGSCRISRFSITWLNFGGAALQHRHVVCTMTCSESPLSAKVNSRPIVRPMVTVTPTRVCGSNPLSDSGDVPRPSAQGRQVEAAVRTGVAR